MTREELNRLIESNIYDNSKQEITTSMVRKCLHAIADYKDVKVKTDYINNYNAKPLRDVCLNLLNEVDKGD